MPKRLRSLRWRTLSHTGFLLVSPDKGREDAPRFWVRVNDFTRHPAVLLVAGFTLTGMVGGWLTHLQDRQQREREATVRSMDDLRTTIDDLYAAFSDFSSRASTLIELRESNGKPADIAEARTDYRAAFYKWQQRLSVDALNIRQRYPGGDDNPAVLALTAFLPSATAFANTCIEGGTIQERRSGRVVTRKIVCTDANPTEATTASDRSLAMSVCVGLFASQMRPDPNKDLLATSNDYRSLKTASEYIAKACDLGKLIGLPQNVKAN